MDSDLSVVNRSDKVAGPQYPTLVEISQQFSVNRQAFIHAVIPAGRIPGEGAGPSDMEPQITVLPHIEPLSVYELTQPFKALNDSSATEQNGVSKNHNFILIALKSLVLFLESVSTGTIDGDYKEPMAIHTEWTLDTILPLLRIPTTRPQCDLPRPSTLQSKTKHNYEGNPRP